MKITAAMTSFAFGTAAEVMLQTDATVLMVLVVLMTALGC